jgi:hypothetical protein
MPKIFEKAAYRRGCIVVRMQSGLEVRFPVSANRRLANATVKQLNNIEISPFGLHWPELDEDLSFRGLLAGDYGQHLGGRPKRCPARRKRAVGED